MNTQIVVKAARRDVFAFTGRTYDELLAFAVANKLVEEPLHLVVDAWKRSKLH